MYNGGPLSRGRKQASIARALAGRRQLRRGLHRSAAAAEETHMEDGEPRGHGLLGQHPHHPNHAVEEAQLAQEVDRDRAHQQLHPVPGAGGA